MKAVILAAGRGRRLGEATQGTNKCMLPIHGRPLIEYSLSAASRLARIQEVLIVVGYRSGDITGRYGERFEGKPLRYVQQKEQRGLVDAVASAAGALEGSDFMLFLGDELMLKGRHEEFLRFFEQSGVFALCGVVKVEDRSLISKTYSITQAEDGRISRLIEKPAHPANDIMGTGNCVFSTRILSYIPRTPVNRKRGEQELPDLIQCAVDDGQTVKPFFICQAYANINDPGEIDRTESYFAHL